MRESSALRLQGDNEVTVVADESGNVEVRLVVGPGSVTLVGSRYDVHRTIIEIDRQLGHLASRFRDR